MSLTTFSKDHTQLKGETVVVTGGARGIGAGIVELAAANGANVVFCDLNVELGQEVAGRTGATFLKADASVYSEVLRLFQTALDKFGKVDHAIANAGVYEQEDVFDPALTLEDVAQPPNTDTLDINLKGILFFSRIAAVYLRQNAAPNANKTLTMLSSVAGLMAPPDTPFYNSTKSGILGLMRSLSQRLPQTHNIRVNAVCPSVTRTPLTPVNFLQAWEAAGLTATEPVDVANVILALNCDKSSNRKILWVESTQAWNVEEKLLELLPQWIGEGPIKNLMQFQAFVAGSAAN